MHKKTNDKLFSENHGHLEVAIANVPLNLYKEKNDTMLKDVTLPFPPLHV